MPCGAFERFLIRKPSRVHAVVDNIAGAVLEAGSATKVGVTTSWLLMATAGGRGLFLSNISVTYMYIVAVLSIRHYSRCDLLLLGRFQHCCHRVARASVCMHVHARACAYTYAVSLRDKVHCLGGLVSLVGHTNHDPALLCPPCTWRS